MKKKIKIGLGILVILGLIYFGYKGFLLHGVKTISDREYKFMYANISDYPIHQDTTNQNDFIGKMHYYVPKKLVLKEEKKEEQQKVYEIQNIEGKKEGQLIIGKANNTALEDAKKADKFVNYKHLFKKYQIQDEIDLRKFYKEHMEKKVTIFSSISKLQMENFIRVYMFIISTGGPNCNYYFLTGDLKGHLTEEKNGKYSEAYLTHNNENYIISFMGTESNITHQEFEQILTSISFE